MSKLSLLTDETVASIWVTSRSLALTFFANGALLLWFCVDVKVYCAFFQEVILEGRSCDSISEPSFQEDNTYYAEVLHVLFIQHKDLYVCSICLSPIA